MNCLLWPRSLTIHALDMPSLLPKQSLSVITVNHRFWASTTSCIELERSWQDACGSRMATIVLWNAFQSATVKKRLGLALETDFAWIDATFQELSVRGITFVAECCGTPSYWSLRRSGQIMCGSSFGVLSCRFFANWGTPPPLITLVPLACHVGLPKPNDLMLKSLSVSHLIHPRHSHPVTGPYAYVQREALLVWASQDRVFLVHIVMCVANRAANRIGTVIIHLGALCTPTVQNGVLQLRVVVIHILWKRTSLANFCCCVSRISPLTCNPETLV